MSPRHMVVAFLLVAAWVVAEPLLSPTPFTIRIVNAATGEVVPGLRVTSDNGIVCYTQPNGTVSWGERSVVGRLVRFTIDDEGHRFRSQEATLSAIAGGRLTLTVGS